MSMPVVSADRISGRMLGHCRVLERIGAGGMGEVYRAHDEHLDREVAIKILPAGTLADDASRKQFRREALALSKLNHPNVATVHDFDTQDGVDFLVMEYVPGTTLSEKLSAGPLPEKELVRLGEQLAEGLSAAHSHGVLHRDLKSGNLRVTPDGRLKILDFGLAKLHAPSASEAETENLTTTRPLAGTLPYMAPEQLRGEPLDARCDIWAAGVVLYQMATGQLPFLEKVSTATADAILHKPSPSPSSLQTSLSSHVEEVILKCLEKDPENRYQSATEIAVDLRRIRRDAESSLLTHAATSARSPFLARHWRLTVSFAVLLGTTIAGAFLFFHFRARRAPPLTAQDSIVLADFSNGTGDPVFDDTLKQALAVQLGQSPFLDIVSQSRINRTLGLMGRTSAGPMIGETAREVCQRVNSKALIEGSIANLGSQYVVGLKALNCATGDVLAQDQVQAATKEDVLNVLGNLASRLRGKLGESLSTIQKFDTPVFEATTSSLEALHAYSQGIRAYDTSGYHTALPFFRHAVALDPKFAMAYARVAATLSNLGSNEESAKYATQAYLLRERLTEREKLYIEARYFLAVTGELEKAKQVYDVWKQTYPRSSLPYNNTGVIYLSFGQYEKAVAEEIQAQRLYPDSLPFYTNAAVAYFGLDRLDDARDVLAQAEARNLRGEHLLNISYLLAFLRGDAQQMKSLVSATAGEPEAEYMLLGAQAETEAYYGQLQAARESSRRAQESARRAGNTTMALAYQSESALREADFSNVSRARRELTPAVTQSLAWPVQTLAALTLARLGDPRAHVLKNELQQRFPLHTLVNNYWIPTIEAVAALSQNHPRRAIELLEPVTPYESGQPIGGVSVNTIFYPVYLRGQAYLKAGEAVAAETEFRKILDHRGIALNAHVVPLARLGLARARVLAHDIPGAHAAYEDFFNLWKDADPDIPILKQAKVEYLKLQ